MKVIAFDRVYGSVAVQPPALELMADSALVLPGKPLFLPDFDSDWICRAYLSVRISRLGKNIAQKFAGRYYDAVGVALRVLPVNVCRELEEAHRSCGVAGLFDGALALGKWIEVSESGVRDLDIEVMGQSVTIAGADKIIAESVAAVSAYATIKMGDVIMPCSMPASMAVAEGSLIDASVNGDAVLALRIK